MNEYTVYLDFETFTNLSSGLNPTAKWEVTNNIKNATKEYIVKHEGVDYRITLDEKDNLILEKI
jgi:hypothetical protein